MVERSKVKITVLKKLKPSDVFGKMIPVPGEVPEICGRFTVGQEFIVAEDGAQPQGFCSWAWDDLSKVMFHLRFGGDFSLTKDGGTCVACCSDGYRPVIFKVERI